MMLYFLVVMHGNINTAVAEATMANEKFDILSVMFLWLGITLYTGWVTAASLLSFTIVPARYGWNPEWWSIVLGLFCAGFYPFVAYMHRDPVYPAVGCWATFAINVKAKGLGYDLTQKTFLVVAIWLGVFAAAQMVYGYVHGGVYGYFFYPRGAEPMDEDHQETRQDATKMGVTNV